MKYQKGNGRNIFLAALSLLLPLISYGQWWNPFEPKDYNECIIKHMKEGMGEDAVRALQSACIQKYPAPKESQSSINERNKREARYKKCGKTKEDYKNHIFFGVGRRNSDFTKTVLSNVKNSQFERSTNSFSFQNTNNFGISGILLGFTESVNCPANIDDYSYSTYCSSSYGTEKGVAAKSFGTLQCGNLPNQARRMGYCKMGYSPFYNQFDDSIIDFQEQYGYCK